jgi:sulfate permease, SulP family
VAVVGFQAPLFFLNAYAFGRQLTAPIGGAGGPVKLIVLEAAGILDIDFTAAQVFAGAVRRCREAGVTLAVARLEAVTAQRAFVRLGLDKLVGADHVFDSVAEAIAALGPDAGHN